MPATVDVSVKTLRSSHGAKSDASMSERWKTYGPAACSSALGLTLRAAMRFGVTAAYSVEVSVW